MQKLSTIDVLISAQGPQYGAQRDLFGWQTTWFINHYMEARLENISKTFPSKGGVIVSRRLV